MVAHRGRPNDELSWACVYYDVAEVRRLLRVGAQINGFSSGGSRPLCQAVERGSHASWASEAPDGDNPHSAELVELLLARGADPNAANRAQNPETGALGAPQITPLELALGAAHECSPQPAIVRALLRAGAKVNEPFKGAAEWSFGTPLGATAAWGDVVIMRMLLRAGARVNGRDARGHTALIAAASNAGLWRGQFNGAYGNARFGSDAALRLLLERGAQVNARDNKGWTALFHAIVEERLDDEGRYELLGSANFGAVKLLLSRGTQVDARDKRGRTPLMWAAAYRVDESYGNANAEKLNQQAMVRLLLRSGATPSLRDKDGRTAQDLARRAKNTHVLRFLP